ncbi:MAG: type II toxin-antitoxin system VapC family toxin [Candidatus Schekmanbacteria bacterium]|nr:type II toxin-antitoxin system VapC family toxin [Candidatus Schekmanbacteria bacterium]
MLVDANLLLYAKIADYPQHARAHSWLDAQLNGLARVGLPWPSLLAFLRISTNPRIFSRPLQMQVAWQQVEQWLALPLVWVPAPTERHATILSQLLSHGGVAGALVADAHLAVLAIEHGLTICSTDGDIARFRGVKWENPLNA